MKEEGELSAGLPPLSPAFIRPDSSDSSYSWCENLFCFIT
jgi:hypothetical protein